jgi:hypothetical protein
MIYYIASYPRSGNTWVRNLIMNQFGYLSSPIHGEYPKDFALDKWQISEEDASYYSLEIPEENDLFGLKPDDPMYRRLARFTPPDGKNLTHRLLLPGFKTLFLDRSIRKRLANEPETYLVKTHSAPYPEYLQGEFVIQIVRHPGATLWSYFNFLKDFRNSNADLTEIVAGKIGFGHWGRYHTLWQIAAQKLNERYVLQKYENLIGHELEFCNRLSLFLHLPIISEELKPFEYYHARNPLFARAGKLSGWEVHYTKEQLELLEKEHGQQMVVLGYQKTD